MTVNELISELQKLPAQTRVVVPGYEEGFDDVSRLTTVSLVPTPNPKEWNGLWQEEKAGEQAILLFGRGRG